VKLQRSTSQGGSSPKAAWNSSFSFLLCKFCQDSGFRTGGESGVGVESRLRSRPAESCGNDGAMDRSGKPKAGFPLDPQHPWKSRKGGEIPTFPQLRRFPSHTQKTGHRRPRAMEKWKSKTRIPTFPPPRMPAAQGKERPFTQNAWTHPSRVRFAAQKPRVLDTAPPFQQILLRRKRREGVAIGSVDCWFGKPASNSWNYSANQEWPISRALD
jgi:hypothetical protein